MDLGAEARFAEVQLPSFFLRVGDGLTDRASFEWSLGLDYVYFKQGSADTDVSGDPIQVDFETESLEGAWEPAVRVGVSYFTKGGPSAP